MAQIFSFSMSVKTLINLISLTVVEDQLQNGSFWRNSSAVRILPSVNFYMEQSFILRGNEETKRGRKLPVTKLM